MGGRACGLQGVLGPWSCRRPSRMPATSSPLQPRGRCCDVDPRSFSLPVPPRMQEGLKPRSAIASGQVLRLKHNSSKRWLHSHQFMSPLSGNQEVRGACGARGCRVQGRSGIRCTAERAAPWHL